MPSTTAQWPGAPPTGQSAKIFAILVCMSLEAAAEIGEAIGGLAGVAALVWNVVDAVRRRREARAPQLRALLDETAALMSEVVAKPQDHQWCHEKFDPVYQELNQLLPVLSHGVEAKVGLLSAYIANVSAHGAHIADSTSAAEVARRSVSQKETAEKALELANSIRRKWV
jgi:hypothetical protein